MTKLGESKAKVIKEEILKENPNGLPGEAGLVISSVIPEYKRVIFLNGRDPGVALQFHYATKTHPLKQYTLYHGFEHELPLEVIEHLEDCKEPQYDHRKNQYGETEHFIKSYKYIFSFKTPRKAA